MSCTAAAILTHRIYSVKATPDEPRTVTIACCPEHSIAKYDKLDIRVLKTEPAPDGMLCGTVTLR